jgi:5,10-methylenetetrahydromethanopterin reductase
MVELAVEAERLGFTDLWLGDSQNLWREVYVTLGAIAAATSEIGIGTGVTNAVTRHPSVIASAWETLRELAGERVSFGIGTGDSSLRTMGMKPIPVLELERRLGQIRALLEGEELQEEESGYRLQFARGPLPIFVAAAGGRSLRMAGRAADGAIACVGVDPRLVGAALERIGEGLAETGRGREGFKVVLWTALAIDDDGAAARDLVRAFTASVVIPPLVGDLDPGELVAIERIRREYDYGSHMKTDAGHRDLVPDSLVERIAVAGTAAECRDQIAPLLALPVDQLAIVPFTAPGQDRGALLRRFRAEVLDQLPGAGALTGSSR